MWEHNYDPLGNPVLSTLVAAVPIVVLLIMIGVLRKPAWMSALAGLGTALVVAILAYGMPADLAVSSALMGAAVGAVVEVHAPRGAWKARVLSIRRA